MEQTQTSPIEYQSQDLTQKIIGAAIDVHKHLGPGLLESAYSFCLALELKSLGLNFQKEVPIPLIYKDKQLDCGFRADFLIEDSVILELKANEKLHPIHESQLLTYLRLANKQVGLLINFNVPILTHGVKRCVLRAIDKPMLFKRDT